MTVNELIAELSKIENKDLPVLIQSGHDKMNFEYITNIDVSYFENEFRNKFRFDVNANIKAVYIE